jgi:FkbM family methyltransferase
MLMFDVGANRGHATIAALKQGYKVIALEPAPKVFINLIRNFLYNPQVIPLRLAASNVSNERIEFYEAEEDGLSTMNVEWLTNNNMPYAGKPFRTIQVNTVTLDDLIEIYGLPELVKIDVEGAEDSVLAGLTKKPAELCFEWTLETVPEHLNQLQRLMEVNGYTEFAPQYITRHLERPTDYYPISEYKSFPEWITSTSAKWSEHDWKDAGLRQSADVGMLWVR